MPAEEVPSYAPLPDDGSLSAMQRQSLLQSTAALAHGPRLLAFPKAAAENYSTRSSAGVAAEHVRADAYKVLETVLERIGVCRRLIHCVAAEHAD